MQYWSRHLGTLVSHARYQMTRADCYKRVRPHGRNRACTGLPYKPWVGWYRGYEGHPYNGYRCGEPWP